MNTEVKKRMNTCLILWAAFVLIKWLTLFSPSSILSYLSPLMVVLGDTDSDFRYSGWISLGIETVLTAAIWFVGRKKISVLYIISMVYALIYVPVIAYWIIRLEFEPWRYLQFMPAVLCGILMVFSCAEYLRQIKIKKPGAMLKHAPQEASGEQENLTETEDQENGSSNE